MMEVVKMATMNESPNQTDHLGVTKSGESITTHRWLNEYFKILVVNHLGRCSATELYEFPAHTSKYTSEEVIVTTQPVSKQGFEEWLSYLCEKGWLEMRSRSDGEYYDVTDKSKRAISHKEHKFNDGVCEVCGIVEKWDLKDRWVSRLSELVENPTDDPVEKEREEVLGAKMDTVDYVNLLQPRDGKFTFTRRDILENIDVTFEHLSEYKVQRRIEEDIQELVEEGRVASWPWSAGAWCLPDLDVKIRDGQVESVTVPKNDHNLGEPTPFTAGTKSERKKVLGRVLDRLSRDD